MAKTLVDDGNAVRVYSPSADRFTSHHPVEKVSGYLGDFDTLKPHLDWAKSIFHFVSTTNPKSSMTDPYHDILSNLLPLIEILEYLKSKRDKYLVFCSSGGAVYGQGNGRAALEEDKKGPQSSYGIVKAAMEDYIQYYVNLYGIKSLILRPSNVYGYKDRSIGQQGLISTLIQNSMLNRETEIWVPIETRKDYIFVSDFVEALIGLYQKKAQGIFNIGMGKTYSILDIIDAVSVGLRKKVRIKTEVSEFAKVDVPICLDISKLKKTTRWFPKTELRTGIDKIISQIEKQNV